jgi:predicted transcriptional regulator
VEVEGFPGVTNTTAVAIAPGPLDRIDVTPPGPLTLDLATTQSFTAFGYDAWDNLNVTWTPTWSSADGRGSAGNFGGSAATGWTADYSANAVGPDRFRVAHGDTERAVSLTVAEPRVPVEEGLPWWLLILVTAAGVLLGLLRLEPVRVTLWTLFMILWARLNHSDILDNKKRGMVVGYLAANPGANYAAIRADLAMATGTLTYHLWVLEKEEEIKSWRDGRFRRYAPSGHRVAELQPSLTDIELLLLKMIRGTPGLTQKALAKGVGVSQPAVSYHISRMAHLGFVRVEKRGRSKLYTSGLDQVSDGARAAEDLGDLHDPRSLDDLDEPGAPPIA